VLNAAGFSQVYLLSTGLEGWKQAGLPVERG
jgi:rhodanese-related sulfurtransferase